MRLLRFAGVTTGPLPKPLDFDDADALLKEAKQRERRRRIAVVAVMVALAVAGGLYGAIGSGGGASGGKLLPLGAARFANAAITVTTRSHSAQVSFSYGDTSEGGCVPASNAPVTSGTGVIDFATSNFSFTESTSGCQSKTTSTSRREVGGTVYLSFPPGEHGQPTSAFKPWLAVAAKQYASYFPTYDLGDALTSASPLRVLHALQGTVTRVGDATVQGVPTTEYVGSATLASFYAAIAPGVKTSTVIASVDGIGAGELVPPAQEIMIQLRVWIDPTGRVSQIQAVEPLYTGVYTNGSDVEGAEQVFAVETEGGGAGFTLPNGRVIPPQPIKHVNLKTLRQQGDAQVTLDFTNFATTAQIVPPPSSQLTHFRAKS